jgi:hypothetical protein
MPQCPSTQHNNKKKGQKLKKENKRKTKKKQFKNGQQFHDGSGFYYSKIVYSFYFTC